jgi:hypothetical protein
MIGFGMIGLIEIVIFLVMYGVLMDINHDIILVIKHTFVERNVRGKMHMVIIMIVELVLRELMRILVEFLISLVILQVVGESVLMIR